MFVCIHRLPNVKYNLSGVQGRQRGSSIPLPNAMVKTSRGEGYDLARPIIASGCMNNTLNITV